MIGQSNVKLKMAVLKYVMATWVMLWPNIFQNIFCSFCGPMLEFINSLTCVRFGKAEIKKALVYEPQYIDRCIDVSCVLASNPLSWFFAMPVKCPQYHHQLHDFHFLRAVGFNRGLHKSHSKDLSQFGFSCKPRVHQAANLDCHVSEWSLKHWSPSCLDCICM